jgi:hypothetical protein
MKLMGSAPGLGVYARYASGQSNRFHDRGFSIQHNFPAQVEFVHLMCQRALSALALAK